MGLGDSGINHRIFHVGVIRPEIIDPFANIGLQPMRLHLGPMDIRQGHAIHENRLSNLEPQTIHLVNPNFQQTLKGSLHMDLDSADIRNGVS